MNGLKNIIFGNILAWFWSNSYSDNLNGQIHPSRINRQGFFRDRPKGETKKRRIDIGVEVDKLWEDEQSVEAAIGNWGQFAEGAGPSQYREIRR